jgi:predicted CoA-binding protein
MKSVAILGASTRLEKYGHRAVVAFAAAGFTVYPVNPRADEVAGWRCYPDAASLPERPDVVSAYLPTALLMEVLPEWANRGCDELWLNPGADGPGVMARARELGLTPVAVCSLIALAGGRFRVSDEANDGSS